MPKIFQPDAGLSDPEDAEVLSGKYLNALAIF